MILGGSDAPVADPLPQPMPEPIAPVRRPMQEDLVVRPAEPKRSGWGLFRSKKKEEPRLEPRQMPQTQAARPVQQPRATAQAEPLRTPQPGAPAGDDLFPDHKRDEQFEIPSFLRNQAN
jgi:hypothetical protein